MIKIILKILKNKIVKRIISVVQYFIILIIFSYLLFQAKNIQLNNINYFFLILAIISVVTLRMTSIYRISLVLRKFFKIPLKKVWGAQSLAILIGLFTPAKMGEGVIIWTLNKKQMQEKIKIASMFAFTKMLDGLIFIPLSLLFAILERTYLIQISVILVIFITALFVYMKVNNKLKIDSKRIMMPSIYLLTFTSLFLQVCSLYFVMLSKGIQESFFLTAVIWSIASIIAMISALPGGLGAREASISFLLTRVSAVDPTTAISISLIHGFILYGTTSLFTLVSRLATNEKI
jgi:glycosyltransferase 2 family protein